MIDPVCFAQRQWAIPLKQAGRHEWVGPCPFCQAGRDRFHVFTDNSPRYWCRVCDAKGFLDSLEKDTYGRLTKVERELLHQKREQERQRRKQEELERRIAALEKMHRCQDHFHYHQALELNEPAREYWWREGMTDESIERYLLGYCSCCPTDHLHRSSYTIPVINRGQLENIRHRLAGVERDKYRPHMAGLGISLFNADLLDAARERIVIVEGSKKSIILTQSGFPSIGIMGQRTFRREWLNWFNHLNDVVIALDPDAAESAQRLGALFGDRARVAILPAKIDDMIVRYGASSSDIEAYLRLARPVKGD